MVRPELYIEAKAKLSDPNVWTKRVICRDQEGEAVRYQTDEGGTLVCTYRAKLPEACSWCMLGAMAAVAETENEFVRAHMLADETVQQATSGIYNSVADFNDSTSTSHSDMLSMFDKIIEKAAQHASAN